MQLAQQISRLLGGWLLAVAAAAAQALPMSEVYRNAQQRDPGYLASLKALRVGEAQAMQAKSLWDPTVMFEGFAGAKGMESVTKGAAFSAPGMQSTEGAEFKTSIYLGASAKAAVTALMPLFDEERRMQAAQLGMGERIAEQGHRLASIFLAQSVAERYLDVLELERMLQLARKFEDVLGRSDAELRKRRGLGDVSQLDLDESAERVSDAKARRMQVESQLEVARLALRDLSGQDKGPLPLASGWSVSAQAPTDFSLGFEKVRQSNPRIRLVQLQRELAVLDAQRHAKGQTGPKVHAIGQVAGEYTRGNGRYDDATSQMSQQLVGVQLTVPIAAGGFRSAQQLESLAKADQAEAELARVQLSLEQEMRTAWHALSLAHSRMPVLQQTFKLAEGRAAQTRRSHASGARSTLELMAAEAAVVEAERAVFVEGLNVVRQRTRLLALQGELGESELAAVQRVLQ
jgi:outer membrane protein TolC